MTQIQFTNALLGLSDKLHYYALSLTSDSERANDLLQETFLKALTYREKFTKYLRRFKQRISPAVYQRQSLPRTRLILQFKRNKQKH